MNKPFDNHHCEMKLCTILLCFVGMILLSSCASVHHYSKDNSKNIVELSSLTKDWFVYKFFQNFKLNITNGKYHSFEKLSSDIFPNGVKFHIGDKEICCICTDLLNYESKREKGIDYYLLLNLFNGKSIKSILDSYQKRFPTILSSDLNNYLKHHNETELRLYYMGKEHIMFSSTTSKGFVCLRGNECDIYCFSTINDNTIHLTLYTKKQMTSYYSLFYEALNLVENIRFFGASDANIHPGPK